MRFLGAFNHMRDIASAIGLNMALLFKKITYVM